MILGPAPKPSPAAAQVPAECARCGAPHERARDRCYYCGTDYRATSPATAASSGPIERGRGKVTLA